VASVRLLVRDREEHIRVARPVQWAIASEIASAQFPSDVSDVDDEAAAQQVLLISTHRLCASEVDRMWVAPLRGSGDHDDIARKTTTSSARALEPLRHISHCSRHRQQPPTDL